MAGGGCSMNWLDKEEGRSSSDRANHGAGRIIAALGNDFEPGSDSPNCLVWVEGEKRFDGI